MSKFRILWSWYADTIYELNCTEIRWYSYYRGQAARLEVDCLWGDTFSARPAFEPGQMVTLWEDDKPIFRGYIFTVDFKYGRYRLVCYDRTRYLLNKDSKIYYNQCVSDIIKNILTCCNQPAGVIADVPYTVNMISFNGASYLDMIGTVLLKAEQALCRRYVLYDSTGRITLKALQDTALSINLTGDNAVFDSERKVSIDDEVYTEVKLTKYSVENVRHKSYTQKNAAAENKYGKLRYYRQVEIDCDSGQMQSLANTVLAFNGSPVETVNLTALGNTQCRAGFMPYVSIPQISVDGWYLIKSAVHTISGEGGYTMQLECVK